MTNPRKEPQPPLRLNDLPVEILFYILDYCHATDLARLGQVCKRFYGLTKDELLWYRRRKDTLATNQVSKRFVSRCNPVLGPRTKWEVTHNWECGRYQKNVILSHKVKLMPWIQLTEDMLWWSGGNQLCGYMRNENLSGRSKVYHEEAHTDICKFIVKDHYIISGHRDGSIKFWWKELMYQQSHFYCSIERAHSRDVDSVDEIGDIVMSGSADGLMKVWTAPRNDQHLSNQPLAHVRVNDGIWSIAADPLGTKVAIGSTGITSPPLYICDTLDFNNSFPINHTWRTGAGILDMVWENPDTLLTCGYDTCIRKWDLRIGKCVSHWSDPTDATIYCISSDYNNTMVTGTQFNCKAVLWDQRKPQYVQLYFMNLRRMSSPVYSISFDSSHLYGATDQNVVEVKFTGEPNIKKNYREIMKYDKFITCGRWMS